MQRTTALLLLGAEQPGAGLRGHSHRDPVSLLHAHCTFGEGTGCLQNAHSASLQRQWKPGRARPFHSCRSKTKEAAGTFLTKLGFFLFKPGQTCAMQLQCTDEETPPRRGDRARPGGGSISSSISAAPGGPPLPCSHLSRHTGIRVRLPRS